jgi:uncharacterized protein YbaR (Trm112 family)
MVIRRAPIPQVDPTQEIPRVTEPRTDMPPAPLDPRLLEILVCPVTKGPLRYDRQAGELVSERAGLAYPIRDGIPIMLPDEARKL